MQISKLLTIKFMIILLITSFACQNKPADGKNEGNIEGEESGPQLAINDTMIQLEKVYD